MILTYDIYALYITVEDSDIVGTVGTVRTITV